MTKKINVELMQKCDKFLLWKKENKQYPLDFDDITWVMHDFVLYLQGQLEGGPDNE